MSKNTIESLESLLENRDVERKYFDRSSIYTDSQLDWLRIGAIQKIASRDEEAAKLAGIQLLDQDDLAMRISQERIMNSEAAINTMAIEFDDPVVHSVALQLAEAEAYLKLIKKEKEE